MRKQEFIEQCKNIASARTVLANFIENEILDLIDSFNGKVINVRLAKALRGATKLDSRFLVGLLMKDAYSHNYFIKLSYKGDGLTWQDSPEFTLTICASVDKRICAANTRQQAYQQLARFREYTTSQYMAAANNYDLLMEQYDELRKHIKNWNESVPAVFCEHVRSHYEYIK